MVADPTTVINYLNFRLVRGHQPNAATELVEAAAKDAYKRFWDRRLSGRCALS